jgi:polyhydroxybutyrate depolymerase
MRRAVVALVLLAACGGGGTTPATTTTTTTAAGADCTSPGRHEETLPAVRGSRTVLVDVPPGAGDGPLPIVIQLHGGGGSPEGMAELTGFTALGARDGVLVVSPEGSLSPKGWVTFTGEPSGLILTETAFLVDLLDHLDASCNADPERVSVVGFSNGAAMALLFACERPDRVQTAVAVAGLVWPGDRCADPPDGLTVAVRVGTDDRVFESFQRHTPHGCCGGVVLWPPAEVEAAWRAHLRNGTVEWTTIPGVGHEWSAGTSEAVWELVTRS